METIVILKQNHLQKLVNKDRFLLTASGPQGDRLSPPVKRATGGFFVNNHLPRMAKDS